MTQAQHTVGPVQAVADDTTALRPLTTGQITGGLWAERRRLNRKVSIPGARDRLQEAGNFYNLELAAGRTTGEYVNDLPFMDSQ